MAVPHGNASQPHLILNPDKALTFTWSYPGDSQSRDNAIRQSPPKTVLTATNPPDSKAIVAFKVKTTAPKRYVVRPPQGIVTPGNSATIVMSMVIKDSMELHNKLRANEAVDEAKDKFLVQYTDVDADFHKEKLQEQDEKAIANKLSAMWMEVDKKKINSVKLTTKFNLETVPETDASPNSAISKDPSLAKGSQDARSSNVTKGSQEGAIFAELSALRKKYDDLVAYTVVLTGERDYLNNECQLMKEKLESEVASKRTEENQTGENESTNQVAAKPEAANITTLLIQAFAIALIAFIAGSFLT